MSSYPEVTFDPKEWFRGRVRRAAEEYGIDPDFAERLVKQESGFNPSARSNQDAQGLMQMIPGTAKRYGVNDPYDAEQNIAGGMRYLADLKKKFNGDQRLMAAGYHSGEGAAESALRNPKGNPKTAAYVKAVAREQNERIDDDAWANAVIEPVAATTPQQSRLAGSQALIDELRTNKHAAPAAPPVSVGELRRQEDRLNTPVQETTTGLLRPPVTRTRTAAGRVVKPRQAPVRDDLMIAQPSREAMVNARAGTLALEGRRPGVVVPRYQPKTREQTKQESEDWQAHLKQLSETQPEYRQAAADEIARTRELTPEERQALQLDVGATPYGTIGRKARQFGYDVAAGTSGMVGKAGQFAGALLQNVPYGGQVGGKAIEEAGTRLSEKAEFVGRAAGQPPGLPKVLAQGAGTSLPALGLGGFGLGGRAAMTTLGMLSQAGQSYDEAKKAGASHQEALLAGGVSAPSGLLELWGVGGTMPRLARRGAAQELVATILREGGEEAILNEVPQGIWSDLVAKGFYDPERDVFKNIGPNALVGFLLGGGMGGGLGALTGQRPARPRFSTAGLEAPSIAPAETLQPRGFAAARFPVEGPQGPTGFNITEEVPKGFEILPDEAPPEGAADYPQARAEYERQRRMEERTDPSGGMTPTVIKPERVRIQHGRFGPGVIALNQAKVPEGKVRVDFDDGQSRVVKKVGKNQSATFVKEPEKRAAGLTDTQQTGIAPSAVAAPPAVIEDAKPGTVHKFSSTQVNLPKEQASPVLKLGRSIPDTDLAADGRETEPHITVKYGLHTATAEKLRPLLANEKPITATIGKTSTFKGVEDGTADAVIAEVDSPDLHRLNKIIADALPHTDTHPDYKPHVTIAYVKPGKGEKYAGRDDLKGTKITLSEITFSGKNGETVSIPLGTGKRAAGSVPAAETAPPERTFGATSTGETTESQPPVESQPKGPAIRPAQPAGPVAEFTPGVARKQKKTGDPDKDDLIQYIRKSGGISLGKNAKLERGWFLESPLRQPGVFNEKTGVGWDDMETLLRSEGFLHQDESFMDALERAARGEKVYGHGNIRRMMDAEDEALIQGLATELPEGHQDEAENVFAALSDVAFADAYDKIATKEATDEDTERFRTAARKHGFSDEFIDDTLRDAAAYRSRKAPGADEEILPASEEEGAGEGETELRESAASYGLSTTDLDRVVAKFRDIQSQAKESGQPIKTAVEDYLKQGGLFGAELNDPQQAALREMASPSRKAADKSEQGALFESRPTVESRLEQEKESGGGFGPLFREASEDYSPADPLPLWEMSYDELDQAAKRQRAHEQGAAERVFGKQGAKRYETLQRSANSSFDMAKADRASEEIARMEEGLTPEQERDLFGIGETGPSLEDYQEFRRAIGDVGGRTPDELAESLKYAVTKLSVDPYKPVEQMTRREQIGWAQLRRGAEIAAEEGWDTQEVSQLAIEKAASRFRPEDIELMVGRFVKKPAGAKDKQAALTEGEGVADTKRQYARRTGPDAGKARQLTLFAIRDLGEVARTASSNIHPAGPVPSGSGAILHGLGITRELIETGRVDLTGRYVSGTAELASLAQIYRDPRFETFRVVWVKDTKIVATEGISARNPDSASPYVQSKETLRFVRQTEKKFGKDMARWPQSTFKELRRHSDSDWARFAYKMRARKTRLEADGYYIVHNHPSGDPKPSGADRALTRTIATPDQRLGYGKPDNKTVPGFKGHVVINSGKYATVDAEGNVEIHKFEEKQKNIHGPDVPHELIGATLRSVLDVSNVARRLNQPGGVTVIYRSNGYVRAIETVPEGLLKNRAAMVAHLKGRKRAYGGQDVALVGTPELQYTAMVLVKEGHIMDYVSTAGSALEQSGVEEPHRRVEHGQAHRVEEEAYHGSPYHFDKFSLEHMGKGEGAQAYGWGLYFAGARGVAEYYKKKLSTPTLPHEVILALATFDHLGFDSPSEAARAIRTHPDWKTRWDVQPTTRPMFAGKEVEALKTLEDYFSGPPKRGALYKVDLKPSEDEYLLWDKPLSEQSEGAQAALRDTVRKLQAASDTVFKIPPKVADADGIMRGQPQTGAGYYDLIAQALGSKRAASENLRSLGIRGIKYLDQGSRISGWRVENPSATDPSFASTSFATKREAEEYADRIRQAGKPAKLVELPSSFNYVIFDDADIAIQSVEEERASYSAKAHVVEESRADYQSKPLKQRNDDYLATLKAELEKTRKTRRQANRQPGVVAALHGNINIYRLEALRENLSRREQIEYIRGKLIEDVMSGSSFEGAKPGRQLAALNKLQTETVERWVKRVERQMRKADIEAEAEARARKQAVELNKRLISENLPKDLQEKILKKADRIAKTSGGKFAKPGRGSDSLVSKFLSRASVAAKRYGAGGGELVNRLAEGDFARSQLMERANFYLDQIRTATDKIGTIEYDRLSYQVIQALENRAEAEKHLKTEEAKAVYEASRKMLDYFKAQMESKGYETRQDYFTHIRDVDLLDQILTGVEDPKTVEQRRLNTFISEKSPYFKPREENDLRYNRDLVTVLRAYSKSASKALAYHDATQYYYERFLRDVPARLRVGSMDGAMKLMRNSLQPERGYGRLYKFLQGVRTNMYRNFLAFNLKAAAMNRTQPEFARMRWTKEADKLWRKTRGQRDLTGALATAVDMASQDTPRFLEILKDEELTGVREGKIDEALAKVDPFQRAEASNWKDAEYGAILNSVMKRPEYKAALEKHDGDQFKAINEVLENGEFFDAAVREAAITAAETQVASTPAMRAEIYDSPVARLFLMFTAFKARQLQVLGQLLGRQEGVRGARAQAILKRGLGEGVEPVELLREVQANREAVENLARVTKKEKAELPLTEAQIKEYVEYLSKQEAELNDLIKQIEPLGGNLPRRVALLARYEAKQLAVSVIFRLFWALVAAGAAAALATKKKQDRPSTSEGIARELVPEGVPPTIRNAMAKAVADAVWDILPISIYGTSPPGLEVLRQPKEMFPYGRFSERAAARETVKTVLPAIPYAGLIDRATGFALSRGAVDVMAPKQGRGFGPRPPSGPEGPPPPPGGR